MDNMATTKSNSLKWGLAIKILVVIALTGILFSVTVYLFYLMTCTGGFSFSYYYLPRYVSVLLMVAIFVLFTLYTFVFHKKQKCAFFIPAVFILFAIKLVFVFLTIDFSPHVFERIFYSSSIGGLSLWLTLLFCILAVISILVNFKMKKIFITVASLACIAYQTTIFIDMLHECLLYGTTFQPLNVPTAAMAFISWCCLYIGLILFALKNNIPPVFSSAHKNAKVKKLTPEQALIALKADRDRSVITEEEYLAQRAEIINNL